MSCFRAAFARLSQSFRKISSPKSNALSKYRRLNGHFFRTGPLALMTLWFGWFLWPRVLRKQGALYTALVLAIQSLPLYVTYAALNEESKFSNPRLTLRINLTSFEVWNHIDFSCTNVHKSGYNILPTTRLYPLSRRFRGECIETHFREALSRAFAPSCFPFAEML